MSIDLNMSKEWENRKLIDHRKYKIVKILIPSYTVAINHVQESGLNTRTWSEFRSQVLKKGSSKRQLHQPKKDPIRSPKVL